MEKEKMRNKFVVFLIIILQMYVSVNLYGAEDYSNSDNSSMDVTSILKKLTSRESPQEVNDYDYGDFEDLTLEISTDTREIIPMEPLPITITLLNKTEKAIMAINDIDPVSGFVDFYVAHENQPFELFRSADGGLRSTLRGERALEPGFKKSVNRYLFYAHSKNPEKSNSGQYLFEESGHYRIKAVFTDSKIDKKIESNVLSIEVKEPTGEDADAYQFFKNMQDDENKKVYYGNFLLHGWIHDKSEIQEKQKEFIEKFPNSQYSRFLYHSLGLRWTSKESQEIQRGEIQRGIDYLEKAAGYEDFLFAEDSILNLIKTFTEIGQTDKARMYKKILAKRFPNSSEGKNYVEEVREQVQQTFQIPPKKPLGVMLPVAGAAVAGIVIAGALIFLRKKKLKKAE